MKHIEDVNEDRVKGYILGKTEYQKVFPKFYELVAEEVESALGSRYPGIKSVLGPRDKERAVSKFPELGDDVPLDWVAFGFPGLDLYDYHIGVVLQMRDWPVIFSLGLHIMDHVWNWARAEVEAIDWEQAVGREPRRVYSEPVREHRWLDPDSQLDFKNLGEEVDRIAHRAVRYYVAAAGPATVVRSALDRQG